MASITAKWAILTLAAGSALGLSACGGGNKAADGGNATTTEMLSTETTLDGTTNDATSLDAAAGANDEVAATANQSATENTSGQ